MRYFFLAATALAGTTPAAAGTLVFNNNGSTNGVTRSYSDGTVTASITGLSYDKSGNFKAVSLPAVWSQGMGIQSSGSSFAAADNQHTVDNSGYVDFLLLTFSESVALTGATFANDGWYGYYDTDASISWSDYDFAANGMTSSSAFSSWSNAATFLNGNTATLSANMFGSDTTTRGTSTRGFNSGLNSGSVWLMGASMSNLDRKTDSFKLSSIYYQKVMSPPPPAVPEPGTWAMLILGMGLVGGAMRRRSAAVRRTRASIAFA